MLPPPRVNVCVLVCVSMCVYVCVLLAPGDQTKLQHQVVLAPGEQNDTIIIYKAKNRT